MDEVTKGGPELSVDLENVLGEMVARRRALVWMGGAGLTALIALHGGGALLKAPSKSAKSRQSRFTSPDSRRSGEHPSASSLTMGSRIAETPAASLTQPVGAAPAGIGH